MTMSNDSATKTGVRMVKVAWLGSLLDTRAEGSAAQRKAATAALQAIDNDDPRGLTAALNEIADVARSPQTRDLAADAARAVANP